MFLGLSLFTLISIGVVVVLLLVLLYQSMVNVGGQEQVILERRWFGKSMPHDRVVAMKDEVGVQARTLGPGIKFLTPFIYKAFHKPFTVIGNDEIGLIESIDGNPIPPGRIFAKVVEGHNSFQDGELFLKNGGEKGPQLQVLPPGIYRINPYLFRVKVVKTVVVGTGQIAVITARDGQPLDSGRLLGKKVELVNRVDKDGNKISSIFEDAEQFLKNGGQKGPQSEILRTGTYRINTSLFNCEIREATIIPSDQLGLVTALDGEPLPENEYVAKTVDGHNNYQNVELFLQKGGQRGPQFDVLKPGTYYINPLMFKVELDKVAVVQRGQVAVVVSNVGEEPDSVKEAIAKEKGKLDDKSLTAKDIEEIEKRLDIGIERYVVPKGYRGIQQEVSGPGIYYLNKRAFMAYIIDTTNITIDWDDAQKTQFDPLKVVSKDGFEISVSVKVIIRVRPDQAPYMVAKIGSIENLVNHVIHPMIDSSFRNQASSTSAMNFMQDRQEEQKKAEERTRLELEKYHVECVSVLICQIKLPQELMDTQTKKIIAQQNTLMFIEQQKAEKSRIETVKTKSEADLQEELMKSEIGVKVAEQNKKKAILVADGEGQAMKLKAEGEGAAIKAKALGEAEGIKAKGEAEGAAILAKGVATAEAYEKQKKAIGEQGIIAIETVKNIATGKVKVTPDVLIQGENGNGLMSSFLMKGMYPELFPSKNGGDDTMTDTMKKK